MGELADGMRVRLRARYRVTAAEVQRLAIGVTLYDGGGLECERLPSSAVQWRYRYTSPVTRQRRETSRSGDTLKAARAWADGLRELVERGVDPLERREREVAAQREALVATAHAQERRGETLRKRVRAYHATVAGGFRNRKHAKQWLQSIEGAPELVQLLDKPIDEVARDVNGLLDAMLAMRDRVPETAARVRMRLDALFADAMLRNLTSANPAAAIARPMRGGRKKQTHLRALDYREVPTFVAALRASTRVGPSVRAAIEVAILCASRSGEVRGMRWNEVDRKAALWVVPATRMKGVEAHRVHLAPAALGLLDAVERTLRVDLRPDALVFAAPRGGGVLSDMAMAMGIGRIPTGRTREDGKPETYGDLTTMHGVARSCFSTWAHDRGTFRVDVIEAALAHREADKVRSAYDRSRTEGERFERDLRALRFAWAEFVSGMAPPHKPRRARNT